MSLAYIITPLEKRSIWLDLELNKLHETTINPSHRKLIHKLECPYVIYNENPEGCFFQWLVNSLWVGSSSGGPSVKRRLPMNKETERREVAR